MLSELRAEHVSKSFSTICALDDVGVSAPAGRVLGLLGQNGAGKSTLLRVLSGALVPTAGVVLLDGETSSPSFLRRKTGILFGGDTGLYEELTAHENILFHGRLRHVDDERIARREYELAEALRVSEYLERRVSELSTGTRQKVAIIRVLIHDPQAIIFDEPEAGLDFSAVRTVLQFLRDQAHECSRIVIISSHSFGDVLEVTDDIAILNHGRLTSIVETRKLTEGHSLQDSFAELERLAIGDA